jgi:hypothetical protein
MSIFFVPAVVTLILLLALLADCRLRWHPREKRATALLRSWLTPEQDKQWTSRCEFEVIGGDTGTRYRITYGAIMNIHQLDPSGCTVAQWCFAPEGGLPPGDVLLAQKIALETMEREALALANSQPFRAVWNEGRLSVIEGSRG